MIALLWAFIGAEDFVSMKKYGRQKDAVEEKVREIFLANGFNFRDTGRTSLSGIPQTALLFAFPALVFILWIAVAIKYG